MDQRIRSPHPLEVFELCTKRVDSIGDERQEKPLCFMGRQCLNRPSSIRSRKVRLLEIYSPESVDLNIKETRWH
jgi:hypothetical protein